MNLRTCLRRCTVKNLANVVIVGVDGAKALGHEQAIDDAILKILTEYSPEQDNIGSGEATGVDSAVRRLALGAGWELGKNYNPFPPNDLHKHWDCALNCHGFKWRNLAMAVWANVTYAVTFKTGVQSCYHCFKSIGAEQPHKVNGGCWTMRRAIQYGKRGVLVVVT